MVTKVIVVRKSVDPKGRVGSSPASSINLYELYPEEMMLIDV
jgi:hypothetical protein